ncbi:MAG: hypothetical protein ABSC06_32735 [Rhodopila sp.]|jgi:hypothetical protein
MTTITAGGWQMGAPESLRHRYGAPAVRPAPYLFLRDRKAERRDGLLVAGRLLCPWPQPLTEARREELARIEARLVGERERGVLGPLGSWVTEDRIVPFTVQSIEWLKRMAADGLRIPIRIVPPVG